ncbi:MAG: prepilin-type N-terminal cleavage/methylation domain-containing protein [Chlamydiia bacterium]|nr:prepilin-type N-terminal cleavage/methylation domain-containing protein [Chlamydiia bacterium]
MTLIELLISMALLSVLMTVLYAVYGQVQSLQRSVEAQREESFRWRQAKGRLLSSLSHASKKGKKSAFYSEGVSALAPMGSLVFTWDNGVDIKPEFAGMVLSRLYVDESQRLCLAIWPIQSEEPDYRMRKEVLMEHVKEWSFAFFLPSAGGGEDKVSGWLEEWAKERDGIPPMVRIKLELENGDPGEFNLTLHNSDYTITYYP